MKITKAKLQNIIKEELRTLKEESSDEILEMMDAIVNEMGADEALHHLVASLRPHTARELLAKIMDDNGIF
tara:strand:+ start:468 stop:680 length:213 start_codon:yes stop_codon:yes gene_type:complete